MSAESPQGRLTGRFMVKTDQRNWICESAADAADAVRQFRAAFDPRPKEIPAEASPMEPLQDGEPIVVESSAEPMAIEEAPAAVLDLPSSTAEPAAEDGLLPSEPAPVEPEPPADVLLAESGMDERLVELLEFNEITMISEVPATKAELMELEGIGPAYAQDILEFLRPTLPEG